MSGIVAVFRESGPAHSTIGLFGIGAFRSVSYTIRWVQVKKLQFASGIVKLVSLAIISIIDLARRCEKKCSHGPTGLTLFPKVVNDYRAQFTCSIYSARRMGQRGETAPITARKKSVAQFSLHPPLVCAVARLLPLLTPIGARRKPPSLKQIL